jgi:4-amino-4-deoxy-L-arabinose transferase-like glycosyltransferase
VNLKDRLSSAALLFRETLWRHRAWLLVVLVVLFALIVRVRLREMPLERDEGEYAYAGQLILQGVPPYKEAYNMKLPGTYAAYAAIMAVFGQSPSGIRLGLALVNAASIVLVFRLGRRLLDEAAGIAAAVAFALQSLSPSVLGLAAHATHFIVLAALSGIWLLLRALEHPALDRPSPHRSRPAILMGASGLLFGLAFLMKQHGLFFGLFGALYLLRVRGGEWLAAASVRSQQPGVRSLRERTGFELTGPASRAGLARLIRDLGWFGLGWLLPYGLTCLVLWWAGVLPQFVFWTITYAARYASAVSLVNGPDMLRSGLHAVVGPNLLFWVLPGVGLLVMWWEERLGEGRQRAELRGQNSEGRSPHSALRTPQSEVRSRRPASGIQHPRFFLMTLLFCSFASTSVGLYFRSHYFITVLPVLALLTGVAVSRALHLLKHDQTIELFLALPILGLFAIGVGAALIGQGPVWLGLSDSQATRSVFGSTLFTETARAVDYLKAHTPKGARVAVLGSEPEIYFLSGRHSASGHIYMYPLMEEHPYAVKMQEEMIGEIEHARPEYIIYIDDDLSWLPRSGSGRKIFDWWQEYWAANMDLVLTLEVEEGQDSGTDMERPAKDAPPVKHILIFKRRQ